MKLKILFVSLLYATMAFGQMQDLKNLAEGELVYSSILYDSSDNLYGYFYLYKRDVDKLHKTMEYVLLDKNLNKVSNNTFVNNSYNESKSDYIGTKCRYLDCNLMGDNILLTDFYYYVPLIGNDAMVPLATAFQIISLKDNTVSKEIKYQDGVFSDLPDEFNLLKKENKKLDTKYLVQTIDNDSLTGFFISQVNTDGFDYKEKDISFYNENRELLWTYEYNPNGTPKNLTTCKVIAIKNNNIYLEEIKYENWYASEDKIVLLDLKTGKKKYETVVEDKNSKYNHTIRAKEVDGKLIITGNYCPFKNHYFFRLKDNLGYYKLVLDENGKEVSRQYSKWSDFASSIKVNKKGRVKNNYRLNTKSTLIFKDGAISVITEKYKPSSNPLWFMPLIGMFTAQDEKTTDMVLINFDEQFQLKSVKTVKKDLSVIENNDYLFSQYIDNEKGGVFFFKDFTKDPETGKQQWMLGINSFINGVLTEEKIPIYSKRKYLIDPLPAKEGYVMLREYNEKEKYNQIRLEKLNF
ncbi:MAG: hypothetical protein Q8914_03180 [Bacteroidota bacterium]|nr:hypothetical protein [Bacteroidota bacterium]